VGKGLEDNDATEPAVEKVERIERDPEELYQWVVPPGQDEQGNL